MKLFNDHLLSRNFLSLYIWKGDINMGVVIIFGLVTIMALFSSIRTLKAKNLLGIVFSVGSLGVFGWFTIMTILHHGYPGVMH
jgi:uncharacterized membrane protein